MEGESKARHNKGMGQRSDPRRIEAFLLSQDGVLDASVWFGRDALRAQVTPVAHAVVSGAALRDACVESLGEAQSPDSILVVPR